jgi:hypothetical protein
VIPDRPRKRPRADKPHITRLPAWGPIPAAWVVIVAPGDLQSLERAAVAHVRTLNHRARNALAKQQAAL